MKQSPDNGIVAWLTKITHSTGLLISSAVGLNFKEQLGEYGSWSPNSTDLYFWYLFVELAVATPVEPRNFVSVVPAAKKGKLGPIFF